MYVLTFPVYTYFRICSLARFFFDRGSNFDSNFDRGLSAFSNACHDIHGWNPNLSIALILASIQNIAPPNMRVATTSHKSS